MLAMLRGGTTYCTENCNWEMEWSEGRGEDLYDGRNRG